MIKRSWENGGREVWARERGRGRTEVGLKKSRMLFFHQSKQNLHLRMENQNSEILTCYFEEAAKKGNSSCFWGAILEAVKGNRKLS